MGQLKIATAARAIDTRTHHFPEPSAAHVASKLVWLIANAIKIITADSGQAFPSAANHAQPSSNRLATVNSTITGCGQRMKSLLKLPQITEIAL
jgi:hypothetical protein